MTTRNNPAIHLDALATPHVQQTKVSGPIDRNLYEYMCLDGSASALPPGTRMRDEHSIESRMPVNYPREDAAQPVAADHSPTIRTTIARADGCDVDPIATAPASSSPVSAEWLAREHAKYDAEDVAADAKALETSTPPKASKPATTRSEKINTANEAARDLRHERRHGTPAGVAAARARLQGAVRRLSSTRPRVTAGAR